LFCCTVTLYFTYKNLFRWFQKFKAMHKFLKFKYYLAVKWTFLFHSSLGIVGAMTYIFFISISLNCRYIDSAGLSGPLPSSFSRLTRMKTLYAYKSCFCWQCCSMQFNLIFYFLVFRRASDNDFTGEIPDYIGSWTNLTEL
jgi:hypothetical protein